MEATARKRTVGESCFNMSFYQRKTIRGLFLYLSAKRNAIFAKMLVPFFEQIFTIALSSDIFALHTISKSERCGFWLPNCNENSKANPILKVTEFQNLTKF